jgi:lipopolysaccharide transport system ATP-binding protein
MGHIAVSINNLGKQYVIGRSRYRYKSLRNSIMTAIRQPFQRNNHHNIAGENYIWALQNITFEVERGKAVAIIGRNGAGKSTLLKILSRITEPTQGYIKLKGRVGSLLEVGTGFHPELTGRDNIYLNGAIIGMKKAEIERKFDEIVAFAEIDKFVDTPVKHYSSGMYVRLAFAVSAHLEPEILIIDEVLAVGDAAFQNKCLGKMGDVAKEGRTVLFVSHNMNAVENLCTSAILLENGRLKLSGNVHDVVNHYIQQGSVVDGSSFANCNRQGNGKLRINSFHLESSDGIKLSTVRSGDEAVFAFGFDNYDCTSRDRVSFSFSVHNDHEYGLFHYYSHFSNIYFRDLPRKGYFRCRFQIPLAPGNYLTACRVVANGNQSTGEEVDYPRIYVPFTVIGSDFYGIGDTNLSSWGPILVKGFSSVTDI